MNMFEFRERGSSGVDEETERLAREEHRILKPGRPESSYKLAQCHELELRRIPVEREVDFSILYEGVQVGEGFIDVLVDKRLILELKLVESLTDVHRAQTIGYVQALNLKLALLINFRGAQLANGIKRVINTFSDLRN